jgi:hypothetical protein
LQSQSLHVNFFKWQKHAACVTRLKREKETEKRLMVTMCGTHNGRLAKNQPVWNSAPHKGP